MNDDDFEHLIRKLHETPQPAQQLRRLPGLLLRAPASPLRRLAAIVSGCLLIGVTFVLISLGVDGRASPPATGSSAVEGANTSAASTDGRSLSRSADASPPAAPSSAGGGREAGAETTVPAANETDATATWQAEQEADAEATRHTEMEADYEATREAIQIETAYEATMQAIDLEQRAWEATRTAQDLTTYCNPYMEDNTC